MKKTSLFLFSFSSMLLLAGCIQQPVTAPILDQQTKEISLYYHNLSEDQKVYESISFNEEFFLPVTRTISVSERLIEDSFTLLLTAELNEAEKRAGFSRSLFTSYDFTIQNISFSGGILMIELVDNAFLMSLSSAEQGILTTSLKKTAQQFPEIQQIILHEEMRIDIE